MKKFLLLLVALLSFVINGCVEDAPVGPEVPVVGSLKLSPEEMTVGAEEGEYSVNIYTEYTFQTSSSVDWIEITYGSCGAEYCTQYFNVKANTTTSPREGVITIFCDDYNLSAELTITQEAGEVIAGIPTNEIWYTSTDGKVVTPRATDVFGANIVSNTYKNGQGVILFDGPVTSIGYGTFRSCTSLTSVTIPDSVTSIREYTFYYCTSLTSVTIGSSVTSIGSHAFQECTSLTSVTIGNSVTSIGYGTFSNCKSLTSVTIPDSVTSIEDWAFEYCSSLTSVTIPDSVTSIGEDAFQECTSLTSVTIGNSVTSIGYGAFSNCKSLKAFYGKFASADNRCLIVDGGLNSFAPAGLTEYTIPDSVTSIGDFAFYWCTSLTSITIPDSVTSIGSYAFRDCKSLTSVTIPDSVTSIGIWAFSYCDSLISVYCKPTTPPRGDSDMFDGNASGRKIYVPTESVEAYKSTQYWSDYASDIVGYDF